MDSKSNAEIKKALIKVRNEVPGYTTVITKVGNELGIELFDGKVEIEAYTFQGSTGVGHGIVFNEDKNGGEDNRIKWEDYGIKARKKVRITVEELGEE